MEEGIDGRLRLERLALDLQGVFHEIRALPGDLGVCHPVVVLHSSTYVNPGKAMVIIPSERRSVTTTGCRFLNFFSLFSVGDTVTHPDISTSWTSFR
jgi:hypothetical protein